MTPPLSDTELIQRLLLAALLGGVLGVERELRQKSAGLRTNILIAIGSALFTLMSYELADAAGADPSRVAAQIVTGIGFLGAGAIMRTDGGIHGLTTAATIWVNAAVGVAAGGGEYHLAFIATGVTLGVLLLLHPIEIMIDRRFGSANPNGAPRPSVEPSAADAARQPAAASGPPSPTRR
jgi:putative Mg2+ transporter-C (MgtC) family protein